MDGYLTEDGIYYLKREGYYALEREKPELCIFVDLSEAFDTVSHAILLEKLDVSHEGYSIEFDNELFNGPQPSGER